MRSYTEQLADGHLAFAAADDHLEKSLQPKGNSYFFRIFFASFLGVFSPLVSGLIVFCWLWLLVALGFWRLLVFVGFWLLAVFGFWRLLAFGGFWLLVAFGFWRLLKFWRVSAFGGF